MQSGQFAISSQDQEAVRIKFVATSCNEGGERLDRAKWISGDGSTAVIVRRRPRPRSPAQSDEEASGERRASEKRGPGTRAPD